MTFKSFRNWKSNLYQNETLYHCWGVSSRFRDLYTNPNYWLDGNSFEYITRYQQELNDQRGYEIPDSSGGYLGSQGKYYQRFRMSSRHLSINLTQEKDAGETLNGPTGFDYTSGHIALKENGKLKDLVIGDYALNFGQGLVLWTGGAFGKGREVVGTTSKNERGLRAYGSAQETDFSEELQLHMAKRSRRHFLFRSSAYCICY